MSKKKTIQESLHRETEKLIEEGIADAITDPIANMWAGTKNSMFGLKGNYRLGNMNNAVRRFSNRSATDWEKGKQNVLKQIRALAGSDNDQLRKVADYSVQKLQTADQEMQQALKAVVDIFPKQMGDKMDLSQPQAQAQQPAQAPAPGAPRPRRGLSDPELRDEEEQDFIDSQRRQSSQRRRPMKQTTQQHARRPARMEPEPEELDLEPDAEEQPAPRKAAVPPPPPKATSAAAPGARRPTPGQFKVGSKTPSADQQNVNFPTGFGGNLGRAQNAKVQNLEKQNQDLAAKANPELERKVKQYQERIAELEARVSNPQTPPAEKSKLKSLISQMGATLKKHGIDLASGALRDITAGLQMPFAKRPEREGEIPKIRPQAQRTGVHNVTPAKPGAPVPKIPYQDEADPFYQTTPEERRAAWDSMTVPAPDARPLDNMSRPADNIHFAKTQSAIPPDKPKGTRSPWRDGKPPEGEIPKYTPPKPEPKNPNAPDYSKMGAEMFGDDPFPWQWAPDSKKEPAEPPVPNIEKEPETKAEEPAKFEPPSVSDFVGTKPKDPIQPQAKAQRAPRQRKTSAQPRKPRERKAKK